MNKLKQVILAGLMLAASIVLGRFLSIRTPIVTIGFSFIPTILTAMLLGTGWSIFVAALADLLGALMFPIGPYFFGYTLSAAISGLIYGIFLRKTYKRNYKQFIWRLIISCILVSVICNMVLNTLWIYVTTKTAVVIFAPTRIIKELVLLPIKFIIMGGLHLTFVKSGAYKKLYNSNFAVEVNCLENNNENNETVNDTKNILATDENLIAEPEKNNEIENKKLVKNKSAKNNKKLTKNKDNNSTDSNGGEND